MRGSEGEGKCETERKEMFLGLEFLGFTQNDVVLGSKTMPFRFSTQPANSQFNHTGYYS